MADPITTYLNALVALEATLVSATSEAINPANVYAFPPNPTESAPLGLPCIWNYIPDGIDPGTGSNEKGGYRQGMTTLWLQTEIYIWLAPFTPQSQIPNVVPWIFAMKVLLQKNPTVSGTVANSHQEGDLRIGPMNWYRGGAFYGVKFPFTVLIQAPTG